MMDLVLAVWSEALRTGYIRSTNIEAWRNWADAQLLQLDDPAGWLADLSLATTEEQVHAAISDAWGELSRRESSKMFLTLDWISLHLGLLYLRFQRGELDTITLLSQACDRIENADYRAEWRAFGLLLGESVKDNSVTVNSQPLTQRIAECFAPFAEYTRQLLQELPGKSTPSR